MDDTSTIALDLARSAASLFDSVLSRVWLTGPGDSCGTCAMATECLHRVACLHLHASVGNSSRIDGPFRRFPIGAREVGRVARSLEPDLRAEGLPASGIADAFWLERHRVRSFGAWPLHQGGLCLGVLAVFSRRELAVADREALAALCRLAAAALAAERSGPAAAPEPEPPAIGVREPGDASPLPMAEVQRSAILAALARTGGKLSGPGGAAEILGMKPTTLESRIRRLGLRKPPRLRLR